MQVRQLDVLLILIVVNHKTAAYYYHRLREIIAHKLSQESDEFLSGEIEVDESYFGGHRKGKRGRGCGWESACIWHFKAWWVRFIRKLYPMLSRIL